MSIPSTKALQVHTSNHTAATVAAAATATIAPPSSIALVPGHGMTSLPGDSFKTASSGIARPAQHLLDATLLDLLNCRLGSASAKSAAAPAEAANTRPEWEGLPESTRQRLTELEELFAPFDGAPWRSQLDTLVALPAFRGLDEADQCRTLAVFEATNVSGRERLLTLTQRELNGKSALLDTDAKGGRLLDSLHGIARDDLDPAFAENGISRAELLCNVLQETAEPGQINQDSYDTCTATSMQYMLNVINPAEYGRLMRGLLKPDGAVKLRNGDTLLRVSDSIAPDSATDRSNSERVFQAAVMDYGNGRKTYSNLTDASTLQRRRGTEENDGSGLYRREQDRALEGLFGERYRQAISPGNIVKLIEKREPEVTYLRMHWDEDKSEGHAVIGVKVENERVYFRNPWGGSGTDGDLKSNPPRRIEDSTTGLESMTVADFKKWVKGALI